MTDLTGQVQQYFKEMSASTLEQCARALGLDSRECLNAPVAALLKKGILQKAGDLGISGIIYEYVRDPDPTRPQELLEKAWRAMRLSKTFSTWDIALYSGASLDYSVRYIRDLKKRGILLELGKDEKRYMRYRIDPNRDSLQAPVAKLSLSVREERIQEAMQIGWKIMSLLRLGNIEDARYWQARLEEQLGMVKP